MSNLLPVNTRLEFFIHNDHVSRMLKNDVESDVCVFVINLRWAHPVVFAPMDKEMSIIVKRHIYSADSMTA